jgi:hypothetical protein
MGLRDRVLAGIRSLMPGQPEAAAAPAATAQEVPTEKGAVRAASGPGPSLLELDQVGAKAKALVLSFELKGGQGKVAIEVRQSNTSYGSDIRGQARDRKAPPIHERGSALSDVFRALAAKTAALGTLDPESIACSSKESPLKGSALKGLCVAACCEAFGLTPPTREELATRRKAERSTVRERQASTRAGRKELLSLLAGGAEGAKKWGDRLAEARKLAPFKRAELSGADLTGARLVAMPEGSFTGATLRSADLSGQDFSKASFQQAILRDAKLRGANLKKANFTGANLEGAHLGHAQLQGAVFADAKLAGAVFERAQFDAATVWPAGFTLPEDLYWVGEGPSPAALVALTARRKREGPVDLKTFMTRLEKTIEKPRMAKALSMLKSERFQLFVEAGDTRLAGIVKSQSDPDLVYSCALGLDGHFGCCTQNLNVCGGLRGSLCKHLLVLVIGIAQAGQIDADSLDEWVQKSALHKPALDRDAMSAILLRYKGAEAGEIDWRPTETVPEDFYAY